MAAKYNLVCSWPINDTIEETIYKKKEERRTKLEKREESKTERKESEPGHGKDPVFAFFVNQGQRRLHDCAFSGALMMAGT